MTGNTPLMLAVKDNKTPLIDRLVELGSDVCARNNDNYNVLHVASMYSREDVVKALLNKKGVDPYATGGSRQQTAAHLVSSRQTGTATGILKTILATAGKDIRVKADNAQTTTGETSTSFRQPNVMMWIEQNFSRLLVQMLMHRIGEGQTSLHIAAAEGDESISEIFYGVSSIASIFLIIKR
ncbi:hypothetical protein PVAND_004389 [Polypedilum vanderplanki]|uniref:Ankyrin repeat protein n=1 Tax=Polypedilum vanderplanki TaxID=319348 RepID=A0A9J6BXK3_POLVA|nr:hypothetical protein PVAND_004389 [Polypedilum vanderplanki]